MIKNESELDLLEDLTPAQKKTLKSLFKRHSKIAVDENRSWISIVENLELSKETKDISGLKKWHATTISTDAIVDGILVFKNGSLMRGQSLNESLNEYTVEFNTTKKFQPPFEVIITFKEPLVEADWVVAQINYRSCIPMEVNYIDSVIDYYLKKTQLDKYIDKSILLSSDYILKNEKKESK